jgi:hypothetical protein
MGFFKRRKDVDGADLLHTPGVQADMERLARISLATSEDDLSDERERQMWRNVEHGAVVMTAAADALAREGLCGPPSLTLHGWLAAAEMLEGRYRRNE